MEQIKLDFISKILITQDRNDDAVYLLFYRRWPRATHFGQWIRENRRDALPNSYREQSFEARTGDDSFQENRLPCTREERRPNNVVILAPREIRFLLEIIVYDRLLSTTRSTKKIISKIVRLLEFLHWTFFLNMILRSSSFKHPFPEEKSL